MKERPILFSGPMVRAILDGRKTQTRRVVKPQPVQMDDRHYMTHPGSMIYGKSALLNKLSRKCPYGQPGDQLWVRETWLYDDYMHSETAGKPDLPGGLYSHRIVYRATQPEYPVETIGSQKWRPSIHMPRWASRINLEIIDVRIERLQDISIKDALAEGITGVTKDNEVVKYCVLDKGDRSSIAWVDMPRSPIQAYKRLWDSINAARGYSWDSNPFIWVIKYERIK